MADTTMAAGLLTPAELDALDTFVLAHMAPRGKDSVRAYGDAVQRALLAKLREQQQPANVVPGRMHCARCQFVLTRVTLCVSTGQSGAGGNETEPCPNGCGPLWPVTWEQEARNCWKTSEALFDRAKAAEDALEALRAPGLRAVDAAPVPTPAQAVPAWQPISTAPKDGRKLVLSYLNRSGKRRTVFGCWLTDEQAAETDADDVGLKGGWYECIDNWPDFTQVAIIEGEPDFWQPLPAAPTPTGAGDEGGSHA